MNKIKIYFGVDGFDKKWVYIAAPDRDIPSKLKDVCYVDYHDVIVNLSRSTALCVSNPDSYCTATTSEMRTLAKMIEYAAIICENNVKTSMDIVRLNLDAEIYIVE